MTNGEDSEGIHFSSPDVIMCWFSLHTLGRVTD